jgi:hypothetical protein
MDGTHLMTNRDPETGIRYGVISQHSVSQAWSDSAESNYGAPTCPECGGEIRTFDADRDGEIEQFGRGCADYTCEDCNLSIDSSDAYSDEPIGWTVDDGEYKAEDCLDSDIMILSSPYYTHAEWCSPCVPGAGNLDSPDPDGPRTYCFGHDWFDDGVAPYPVYRVSDDSEVAPWPTR